MYIKAGFHVQVTTAAVSILFLALLPGCPDPNPDPDPDPQTESAYFQLPTTFGTSGAPSAIVAASVNTDAFPDIVTANSTGNSLTYWLSTGNGAYARQDPLTVHGTAPAAVAVRDLNGDGSADLVCANAGSDNLSVFFGAGEGTFGAEDLVLALPAGAVPRDVGVLDANGDGLLDLAVANSGLASISILLAVAEGGYAEPVELPTGNGPQSLLVADLNKDSRMDVITADRDANALTLFVNESDGLFAVGAAIPTGVHPRTVLARDFDNDGWLDLAVSNAGASSIGIHMGAGAGALDAVVFTPVVASPEHMALGDFNGDGLTDILAVLFNSETDAASSGIVLCLAGDGQGRFSQDAWYALGTGVVALAAEDFDRDGTVDVAACNGARNQVLLIDGLATGGLAAERRYPAGTFPRTAVAGDLNRDSHLDLVVGNLESSDVTVLPGNGDGTFGDASAVGVGGIPRALALGFIDGDNRLDLAATNLDQSRVAILLGQSDGSFGAPAFVPVRSGTSPLSVEPRSIVLADVNGDNHTDLVAGNANRDSVAILLGDGAGAFEAAVEYPAGNFPLSVHVTDYNGDGDLDIVLANGVDAGAGGSQTSAVRTIPGKGDGTFDTDNMVGYVANTGPGSLVVRDLNQDGFLDLATSHYSLDSIQIFSGRGDGRFGNGGLASTGDGPNALGVADVNGDGRPDLYTTNDNSTVTIRLHRAGFLYQTAISVPVGNFPIDGLILDLDGDGALDLVTPNRGSNDVSVILGRAG